MLSQNAIPKSRGGIITLPITTISLSLPVSLFFFFFFFVLFFLFLLVVTISSPMAEMPSAQRKGHSALTWIAEHHAESSRPREQKTKWKDKHSIIISKHFHDLNTNTTDVHPKRFLIEKKKEKKKRSVCTFQPKSPLAFFSNSDHNAMNVSSLNSSF